MRKDCAWCGAEFETSYKTVTCSVICKRRNDRKVKAEWNSLNKEKCKKYQKATDLKRRDQGKAVAYHKARRASLDGYVDRLVERARAGSHDTDIDRDFISLLMASESCQITGVKFEYSNKYDCFHNPLAPSLDRKDSKVGYYKDNVQVVLSCINKMKGDLHNDDFLPLWSALKGE